MPTKEVLEPAMIEPSQKAPSEKDGSETNQHNQPIFKQPERISIRLFTWN